ncbi:MAG TPA: hypothetical protein VER96_28505 [Polyangiaceae bacterium]|nr:hypothetical protein [Polyangiaceae bacterium]
MLHRKMPRRSSAIPLLATITACCWSAPARAQSSDAALAESLFREGKRLSAERKFAEACPKFAESYKLDPGLGTQLNLALCHESEGKLATAWAEFSEASSRAKREGDADRAALADEHVRALEPKLAHISIALAPGASVPGLIVKFDSRELASAALGLPIAVDPGKHVLEASAPGKEPSAQTFEAPSTPTTVTVTVPVLKDSAPAPVAVAPVPAPAPAPANPPPAPPPSSSSGPNTGAIVAGVATGVFAAGSVVTGVLYSSKRSDFNDANASNDPSRFDKRDEAKTWGTLNMVMIGGTAVSAGFLVYFLVSGGKHEASAASAARLRLTPVVSPQVAGLVVGGSL